MHYQRTPAKLLMGRELRGKIPAFTENESKIPRRC